MKLLLKSLGFIVLFIFLILLIIVLIPDSTYKTIAEKSFQKFTDRTLSIGELHTKRNLNPVIEISNVSVSNPQWAKQASLLSAGKLNGSVDLIELIKGNLDIDLTSEALNIDLLRNTDGENNWQFKTDDSSTKTETENPSVKTLARFVLRHLNMSDFKLTFTDEQPNTHHELSISNMKVIESDKGIAQNITLEGAFDNLPLTLTGSTGTLSELGHSRNLPFDLQSTVDNVMLSLNGNIDAQTETLNLLSDIQLSSPDLGIVSQFSDLKLPPDWRDIKGSAKIKSTSGIYSLEDIKITMDGGLKLDVSGMVADLAKLQGVDALVNATLESVQGLSSFTADPLPDLGPIDFSGKIKSDNEKLSLESSTLSYDGEYGNAEFTGDVGDLINVDQANLKATASLPNLNIVKLFSDADIPKTGEINISSDLISDAPSDISAENIMLDYDHQGLAIKTSGSIKSIIKNGGDINLDITTTIDTLDTLNELAKTELPALGPLDVSTNVNGSFKQIRVNQIVAEIKDETLSGNIKGDIGAISNLDAINLSTELMSPSIAGLLKKIGIESAVKSPLSLSATARKNNDNINIEGLTLDLDGNSINAELALVNVLDPSKRQKYSGTVNVKKFNLDDILDPNAAEQAADPKEKSGFALPDTPLPFGYIRDNDLDFTVNIDEFTSRFASLSNTAVKLVSDQGKLTLGPVSTKVNGGDTNIDAGIDASSQPATTSVDFEINGFSIKQAGTFEGSELLENEGSANAKFEFRGTGESVASMLANSNGGGQVLIENLTIKNETIKFVSGDLVTEAAAALNPLDEKSNTTVIHCSAAKFDINDGEFKTAKGYIADSEAFTITGDARINFKDQGLDVTVNTNPKEGLGLGLGELARAIQIQGTLAEPKVGLNAKGVAELGASIGAAVATGGVSLLAQGQIEKLKANTELCSSVLE